MPTQQLSRVGAASGAVFAILLVVAAGDGGFSPTRAILGLLALSLAIPFICTLGRALRGADADAGWLVDAAIGAGVGGIVLKIASGAPELAIHRTHVAAGTPMHHVLSALGDAATVLALFPLAVLCAGTAIVAWRRRMLPRWLAFGAGLTALALVVNGCFLNTSFVPALLVFALWVLLTSGYLMLANRKRSTAPLADAPMLHS